MILQFPENFIWGTSTASAQIETPSAHDWRGVQSKDGFVFNRTCDHELRREEDAGIISDIAPYYRMSVDWSLLQEAAYAPLQEAEVQKYLVFMHDLKERGVKIMLVLHHFANPIWFAQNGHWEKKENIAVFVDYAQKVVDAFGPFIAYWNTFNEPCVYATNSRITGLFPPFTKNIMAAFKTINHMGKAHGKIYDYIKQKIPESPIGISKNTCLFEGVNLPGKIVAKLVDWWFMDYCYRPFESKMDFQGISYYARILFDPFPITEVDTPGKLAQMGLPHDGMWNYYPQGMRLNIKRYWNKNKKPVIITESGICTDDDKVRIKAINDYLTEVHECIREEVPVLGYFFWSTMDNFEWNLGPTYRFGLVEVDLTTKNRKYKPSAYYYKQINTLNQLSI